MLRNLKQVRAAISMLNPAEVRKRVERPVHIGLIAASGEGYSAMEGLLAPADLPREARIAVMEQIHRAGDRDAPDQVDLVLYQHGVPNPEGTYTFDWRS